MTARYLSFFRGSDSGSDWLELDFDEYTADAVQEESDESYEIVPKLTISALFDKTKKKMFSSNKAVY